MGNNNSDTGEAMSAEKIQKMVQQLSNALTERGLILCMDTDNNFSVQEIDPREWDGDKDDEYTAKIKAAHPMNTKDHETYRKACDMVHNRHSKHALIDLVNWLLKGQP